VLILDDTGILKKVCARLAYSGSTPARRGPRENCQIGVFLAHATDPGHALVAPAELLGGTAHPPAPASTALPSGDSISNALVPPFFPAVNPIDKRVDRHLTRIRE
jgi:hypothetical protein